MISRRGFLGALSAAIAGAAASFDPERALWVPGKRLISIPATLPLTVSAFVLNPVHFAVGDIVTIGRDSFVVTRVDGTFASLTQSVDGALLSAGWKKVDG